MILICAVPHTLCPHSSNSVGATAFCSYGAFWWSFAVVLIPWFGVVRSAASPEGVAEDNVNSALGIYLSAWFIFTFIMFVASLRSSIGLVLLFGLLDITFLLLFISYFVSDMSKSAMVAKAGGGFGIATAAGEYADFSTPDIAKSFAHNLLSALALIPQSPGTSVQPVSCPARLPSSHCLSESSLDGTKDEI